MFGYLFKEMCEHAQKSKRAKYSTVLKVQEAQFSSSCLLLLASNAVMHKRFIFRHQRDRNLRCKEIVHKWLKEKTNDVIQISATKLYVYVNCSCII